MAKKWARYKEQLEPFQLEPDYQQQVDAQKKKLASLSTGEIGKLFKAAVKKKQKAEETLKGIKLEKVALDQLLVERLEGEQLEKLGLAGGITLFISDEPLASVTDKGKLFAFIKREKMITLLSVHSQTLNALVKERLTAGQAPPPGVAVFMKTKIGHHGISKGGDKS